MRLLKNRIFKNLSYSTIRTLFNILYPVLVFPYISRLFGPLGIGNYDFCNSIVNYLTIFASFGVGIYGVREIGKVKDKLGKRKIYNELFTINFVFTIVSIVISLALLLCFDKLYENKFLYIILLFGLIFDFIGSEWFFVGEEKQKFITIRTIVIRVFTIISVFLFVKSKNDISIYAAIVSFSLIVNNCINFLFVKKNIRCRLVFNATHLKPMLLIFIINLLVNYFGLLDVFLFGLIGRSQELSNYTVALRVYKILYVIITSSAMVVLPRLSYYIIDDKSKFFEFNRKMITVILVIIFGLILSLYPMTDIIVNLLSGLEFVYSAAILRSLFLVLIFSVISNFFTFQYFYPKSKEGTVLWVYFFVILLNIVLIFVGYDFFKYYTLVFSYLISQIVIVVIQFLLMGNDIKFLFDFNMVKILSSFVISLFVMFALEYLQIKSYLLSLSTVMFFSALLWVQNETVFSGLLKLMRNEKN